MLSEELNQSVAIEAIINRVIEKLSKPYPTTGQVYNMEVFVGATVNQPDTNTPEDLILIAEEALKEALATELSGSYIIAADVPE